MKSSLQTTRRITLLGLALAAFALLSGGTAGAQAVPKSDLTASARMAVHFRDENALYAAKVTSGQARSPAEAMALHFRDENKLYRARVSASSPLRSSSVKAAAAGDGKTLTASPPISASGTFTTKSSSANSVRFDGGNLILDESGTVSYTGTFSGTSTFHGILIIHADGSANFHDVETFTGTVNGVPGTVTLNLNGRNDATRAVQATDTIVSATGDLAGLHGVLSEVGTVLGPPGPSGTYTGQIQSGSA